jgi:uncharacterized protein (DUF2147 family)
MKLPFMLNNCSIRIVFLFAFLLGIQAISFAQAHKDPLERNLWYNEEKNAKIQIYLATDGKFYGKVVWLKVPDRNGGPKLDPHNPDKARRNDPLLGMVILKGFKKSGADGYEDGTIYDPKNGKTYSCKMTRKEDKLDVRGYIGFSLLGRTTTWTKAEE